MFPPILPPLLSAECSFSTTERVVLSTAIHCTVLHFTVIPCTILHFTVLHCSILNCTVLYFTALHHTALDYTGPHCTKLLHKFHYEIVASINFDKNKILSPGLENNHTLKCCSGHFQHNYICQRCWKNTISTFECMVNLQSRGQGPEFC